MEQDKDVVQSYLATSSQPATTATAASASASAPAEEKKATDTDTSDRKLWADEPIDPRYICQDIDLATVTEEQLPELKR